MQINNVLAIEPRIASWWSKRHLLPSDSFELANQDSYTVQWIADSKLKCQDSRGMSYMRYCRCVFLNSQCIFRFLP